MSFAKKNYSFIYLIEKNIKNRHGINAKAVTISLTKKKESQIVCSFDLMMIYHLHLAFFFIFFTFKYVHSSSKLSGGSAHGLIPDVRNVIINEMSPVTLQVQTEIRYLRYGFIYYYFYSESNWSNMIIEKKKWIKRRRIWNEPKHCASFKNAYYFCFDSFAIHQIPCRF